MAVVLPRPSGLSEHLELFHTTDPLLYNSPVLVFYGDAPSIGAASSRIQVHVYTPAGLESYSRLSISPASPYYSAVSALPREEQGDEVCRGIAYALSKYFTELPPKVKQCWIAQISANKRPASPFGLFSPTHVAVLASRLGRVENVAEVIESLRQALGEQRQSWLDVDVILPTGSIATVTEEEKELLSDEDICRRKYGRYAPIVAALGEPSFLPTSSIKRAASKPLAIGRNRIFSHGQQEAVRKEMCEVVDTESSYLQKLIDLWEHISFSLKATVTSSSDEKDLMSILDRLFPKDSLEGILRTHQSLLSTLQAVLDDTDDSAIAAIESAQIDAQSPDASDRAVSDVLGISAFAKALINHLPGVKDDYARYMSAHSEFPSLLKSLFESTNGDLSNALHEIGEQRLTSLLIEPIQRLPRYSLYIDTISKQLPLAHPAMKLLLKARDIVTDICLIEEEAVQSTEIDARLAALVSDWPSNFETARLVTAVDVIELDAPFVTADERGRHGILLVFTNRIKYIIRSTPQALTARTLQTEIRKSRTQPTSSEKSLTYIETFDLTDCILAECLDGKALTIHDPTRSEDGIGSLASFTCQLQGPYGGKAARLVEEMMKARIEGRFEDTIRSGGRWEFRTALAPRGESGMLIAMYEKGQLSRCGGSLRIEIDIKESTGAVSPKAGTQAKIRITPGGNTFCNMAIDSIWGSTNREKIGIDGLASSINRKVLPILQAQFGLKETPFLSALVARNREVLESLDLVVTAEAAAEVPKPIKSPVKHARPISPVKQISNFLNNRANSGHSHLPKRTDTVFTAMPNLQPRTSSLPKSKRTTSRIASKENVRPASSASQTGIASVTAPAIARAPSISMPDIPSTTKSLDDTLSTYLLALQARKGNVVGRVLQARHEAQQSEINSLYNSLLADPNSMTLAAQAPVDILFSAFERFLQVAWYERYGSVVTRQQMEGLQDKAETTAPKDFEAYFASSYDAMSTENQRAFKGIVVLLAELLEGAGNDGDRGILTRAFTELLLVNEDPVPFISMMDKFVNDIGPLFGEYLEKHGVEADFVQRAANTNTQAGGSMSAKDSSLRKKFGFGGISRENSKSEHDSKVGSVWRSLSKSKHGSESTTPQLGGSETFLADVHRKPELRRPISSDATTTLGQFAFERPKSQDSAWLPSTPLSTIGETGTTPATNAAARKKRRSSLSDLSVLQSPNSSPVRPSPATSRLPAITGSIKESSSPSRINTTPLRGTPRSRLPSSFRKENSPVVTSPMLANPTSPKRNSGDVVITSYSPGKSRISTTRSQPQSAPPSTPTRIGLSERSSANAMKIRTPSPIKLTQATNAPSPINGKLRMQSPQKLRERLTAEQREFESTSAMLEQEIAKVSADVETLSVRKDSVRTTQSAIPAADDTEIAQRLSELKSTMNKTTSALEQNFKTLQDETLAALALAENRTKRLDELYREANAENEALYKRFNDELAKAAKLIRSGEGVEELKRRVKMQQDEMEGMRRERSRLKREVVGLRGRLGE